MKYFLDQFLEHRSMTVKSILDDYDKLTAFLAKCGELLGLLKTEELAEAIEVFKAEMNDALIHYGVERPDAFAAAEDPVNLAFLRLDTLRSIETLMVHQFSGTSYSEEATSIPIREITDKSRRGI